MGDYAVRIGFTRRTMGVMARKMRNLAIYLHWGFTELVRTEQEDGEIVLYYAKNLEIK